MAKLSAAQKAKRKRQKKYGGGVARPANNNKKQETAGEPPADRLALEVRSRMTGLPIHLCSDQKMETYMGRLALMGVKRRQDGITTQQYDALHNAFMLRQEYERAISAPNSLAKRSGGMTGDMETDSFIEWSQATKDRYDGMVTAIQEAQYEQRQSNMFAALQYIVYQNQTLPHMIGDLRLLANALDHFFKGN